MAYGDNITLTGHSLGAGLASIVAVWFDRPAVIFDAAPFEATARNPIYVSASRTGLSDAGYVDPAFAAYDPVTNFLTRESAVTAYYLQGEALALLRAVLPTVQGNSDSAAMVRVGINDFLGAEITLHSQALLTATLMSESFRASTEMSQRVLLRVMDERLYEDGLMVDFFDGARLVGAVSKVLTDQSGMLAMRRAAIESVRGSLRRRQVPRGIWLCWAAIRQQR